VVPKCNNRKMENSQNMKIRNLRKFSKLVIQKLMINQLDKITKFDYILIVFFIFKSIFVLKVLVPQKVKQKKLINALIFYTYF